jgi:integrase
MLKARKAAIKGTPWVFPGDKSDSPILGTSLGHQHDGVKAALKLPADFVIHSLRHTMLTRLGEPGADALTIMRIAGHSCVPVSQRYVHPTPEGMERAFERLEELNAGKYLTAEAEAKAEATESPRLPADFTKARKTPSPRSSQIVEIKNTGP